jgi:thiosulfate/3-mercaptopyruvate sulfurtransferase
VVDNAAAIPYNGRMRHPWIVIAAFAASAGMGQDMLVTAPWLAAHLNDRDLVVLHSGAQQDYDAGHIPNSRLVTLQAISITGDRGLRLELPPVEKLREAFESLGISEGTRIVIYPGNGVVQSATRVWFTLDYLGLGGRAALLDGGLPAWRAQAGALSTRPAMPAPKARLTVVPNRDVIVDAEWVRRHAADPGVAILDARTPEFYRGDSAGMMPRAGHIPGAINIPFTTLLNDGKTLKSPEILRELLTPAAHRLPVIYCHIGQQATLLYFVARYLGMSPRLYDGSFQDWSTRPGLPVERAAN